MERIIRIEFLSEWNISSGVGDGHKADSLLVRDTNSIPVIPGRAVKGALREGAWRLSFARPDDLSAAENFFWGSRSTEDNRTDEEKRNGYSANEGKISVSQARLAEGIHDYYSNLDEKLRKSFLRDLVSYRAQTALDNRQAKKGSLRNIEVGIKGLSFDASVYINERGMSEEWIDSYFVAVCAAVKSIGGGRSRGLGVCKCTWRTSDGKIISPSTKISMPSKFTVK